MNVHSPDIPDSFPARAVFGRPAVLIFCAIALGILLSAWIGYGFVLAMCVVGIGCGVAAWGLPERKRAMGVASLFTSLVLLSGAWTGWRIGHAPDDSLARVLDHEPALLELEGMVLEEPRVSMGGSGVLAASARYAPPSVRFLLRAELSRDRAGGWSEVTGSLYASVTGTESIGVHAGDRVRVLGMASALRASGNPGAHDPVPGARQRGIVGSIRIDGPELVEIASPASGLDGALDRVRARTIDRIDEAGERSGNPSASALLGALLLGERSGPALKPLEDAFTRTGVGHFLAISGLHVGMVLVGVSYLVRTTGDRPRLETALVIVAAVLLLVFIPARPPVLRAVLIALALILTQSTGRAYDRLSVLALVAAVLLIFRPVDLFNPGFQLTFLVVAALIVCTPSLRTWMFGERPGRDEIHGWSHAWHWLKDASAVSLCASAISTPLIALHFGVFSPLAAPLSVLLMPLVALILGAGYLALVVGSIVPAFLDQLIELSLLPAIWLSESVRFFDALPGMAFYLPSVSWPMAIALIVVLVWWMFPSYTSERPRWIASVIVVLPLLWSTLVGLGLPRSQTLRLDMLDVGDGTSILLRNGRESVLYDCGSRWLGIGEREIPRAVRALGSGRIDTVIVSHADIDHFSGLIDAARPLGVRRVIVPRHLPEQAEAHPDGAAALLLRRLQSMGIRVEVASRGDRIPLGDLDIEVLHPDSADRFNNDNDGSLVLRVRAGSQEDSPVVLLLGDIERDAMMLLESREPELRAEIIEVPHHGSARSFAYPFVEAIDPSYLLQSTGPSRLLDERWDIIREGRQWFTTASDGAITIIVDRDGSIRSSTHRNSE